MKPFRSADDYSKWVFTNCHYCRKFDLDPEHPIDTPCHFPTVAMRAQIGMEVIPDHTMTHFAFDATTGKDEKHWFAPERCPHREEKRGRPSKAQPRTLSAKSEGHF